MYRAFPDHKINIELKADQPGAEEALWRVIGAAGAQDRTLVVTDNTAAIQRFRRSSGGSVATAVSAGEFVAFELTGLIGLGRLYKPPFGALQPPYSYKGVRIVSRKLIRKAHKPESASTFGRSTGRKTCAGSWTGAWTAS